jgi:acetyltransferase-like isoleucine patch superfamily enzyme
MNVPLEVLTADTLTRTIASRWLQAYGPIPLRHEAWRSPEHEATYQALLALGERPSQAAVEQVLGTPLWTHIRCTLCGHLVTRAVRLRLMDAVIDLCAHCLGAAYDACGDFSMPPTADIADNAVIGEGTKVWSYAVIARDVVIGRDCVIGAGSHVMVGARLGDAVRVQSQCFICEGAEVGHRVFFGVGVVMSADKYPRVGKTDYQPNPPIIEDDVVVGSGAILLPGVRLGAGCFVGAGAVVTRSVAPGQTVVGNPARPLEAHRPEDLADLLGVDEGTYTQLCFGSDAEAPAERTTREEQG